MTSKPDFLVNSKNLFVEYDDIIRANQLVLLFILSRKGCPDAKIFNVDLIKEFDALALYEWYIHRKHMNICKCLCKDKKLKDSDYTEMLTYLMSKYTWCYSSAKKLLGFNLLSAAIESKICENIYVYSDYTNEVYTHDVQTILGIEPIIIGGDFERSIASIPTDATYILCDPHKIKILYDMKKVNCTSILLSHDCDFQSTSEIDESIQEYLEDSDHPVKINYFNPISMAEYKKVNPKNN